jgi:hypothetical protein
LREVIASRNAALFILSESLLQAAGKGCALPLMMHNSTANGTCAGRKER